MIESIGVMGEPCGVPTRRERGSAERPVKCSRMHRSEREKRLSAEIVWTAVPPDDCRELKGHANEKGKGKKVKMIGLEGSNPR